MSGGIIKGMLGANCLGMGNSPGVCYGGNVRVPVQKLHVFTCTSYDLCHPG